MDQSAQNPEVKTGPAKPIPPAGFFLHPEVYFPALMLQHPECFQMNPHLIHPFSFPRPQVHWPSIEMHQNSAREGLAQRLSPGLLNNISHSGIDLSKQSAVSSLPSQLDLSKNDKSKDVQNVQSTSAFSGSAVPASADVHPILHSEVQIDTNVQAQAPQNINPSNSPINFRTNKQVRPQLPASYDSNSKNPQCLTIPEETDKGHISEPNKEYSNLTPRRRTSTDYSSQEVLQRSNSVNLLDIDEDESAYAEFRQKILNQLHPNHNRSNENMRRNVNGGNPNMSDPTYVEKRRKNNEAAKRSRDARKLKEDEIAIRCAFLEQINLKLKLEFAEIEKEKKLLMSHFGHLKR